MPVLFDWSGKLGKPGSESNRFWCGKGAKCPWVNGERGPRCGLMHPQNKVEKVTTENKVEKVTTDNKVEKVTTKNKVEKVTTKNKVEKVTIEKDMESGQNDWSEKFVEYFGGLDDMIKPRKVIRLIISTISP